MAGLTASALCRFIMRKNSAFPAWRVKRRVLWRFRLVRYLPRRSAYGVAGVWRLVGKGVCIFLVGGNFMLEILKKLVIAWDPDFTKVTLKERIALEEAEKDIAENGTISHDAINWD